MSRRGVWLALAGCLAIVVVPGASARTMTLQVVSNSISYRAHDIGPKGASKGDTIAYHDELVNDATQFGRKKGAIVGSDTGKLTFTGPHTATFEGSARLPGGTLRISGAVYTSSSGELVFQVTDGTGDYAGTRGTLTVGKGRNHVLNTYRLTSATLVA
jgi:hypothetical protein